LKRSFWLALAIAICISFAIAGVGASLTQLGPWYFALKLPSWKPPAFAFGIILSTIFTLCAFSAASAWTHAETPARKRRVWVFSWPMVP
jgi:tryptophan-rich sensory protein